MSLQHSLLLSLAFCLTLPAASLPAQESAGVFRSSLTIDRTPLDRDAPMPRSYAGMLEKVQPSVVTILTGIETPRPTARRALEEDLLRFYFGLPPRMPERMPNRGSVWQQIGLGSGVIVSADGYILTNRHVIFPPDSGLPAAELWNMLRIRVSIPGRETPLNARVIDYSTETDVAVLKVDGSNLPSAVLADSDAVKVGDVVFALGAPFGIDKTVTMGIVSARRNDEVLPGFEKQELIQTDASINPGNSGGPLIDSNGRVIGINTAIFTRSGGNMGIGFAIPINTAVAAADALSRPRGYLGVATQHVDRRAAAIFGLKGGAFVGEVVPGSPADRAGIQVGDVIFSVNGVDITTGPGLVETIGALPPGRKVTLGLLRDERRLEVDVVLGERENRFLPGGGPADGEGGVQAVAGMRLAPVPDHERDSLRLPEGGVVISGLEPDSPAASCGLQPGDVITRIDGNLPASPEEAAELLRKAGTTAKIYVRRGNSSNLILLPVGGG